MLLAFPHANHWVSKIIGYREIILAFVSKDGFQVRCNV
nr:MAG TPA: hypothetical protein [Caudoviricetes sp.]